MEVDNLIERVYNKHFGLFMSIGMNTYRLEHETIKEKIQEAFTKVWKNRKTIKAQEEAGVRSFALSVFRNTCISHLRKPNPFVDVGYKDEDSNPGRGDSYMENVADLASDPLNEILLIEEKRLQNEVIHQLPPKYREPVRLSLAGMKRKDIAEKLGIRETTIHNLKHRGLKKYEIIINRMDPLRKS